MGYQTTNPYTNEVLATFDTATPAQINATIAATNAAYRLITDEKCFALR